MRLEWQGRGAALVHTDIGTLGHESTRLGDALRARVHPYYRRRREELAHGASNYSWSTTHVEN
jgi:hypothetical protein